MSNRLIKTILVVDDQEEYRSMLSHYLTKLGYEAATAVDAEDAARCLAEKTYHLVISDVRMEGKDGIVLMKESKSLHPGLEFIIMTGYAADYSYCDIIAAGAADFVVKPFEMGKLQSKLERIEREKQLFRQLENANAELNRTNRLLQQQIEEKERIAEELRHAKRQLEELLSEKVGKLSKAGELLRQSRERFSEINGQ